MLLDELVKNQKFSEMLNSEDFIKEIRKNGAYAFVEVYDTKIQRQLLMTSDETYCELLAS